MSIEKLPETLKNPPYYPFPLHKLSRSLILVESVQKPCLISGFKRNFNKPFILDKLKVKEEFEV
jgi:hypothetical protein